MKLNGYITQFQKKLSLSHESIFVSKDGKKSCHQYIGKAGSPAFIKAVEMVMRRTKIEGLQQSLHTVELGLADLW